MIGHREAAPPGPDVGPLAAWLTAWLRGRVGADDLVGAVPGVAGHRVRGLPGSRETDDAPWSDVLAHLRRRRAGAVRAVLPVPGDVRGLPAGSPAFTGAALEAGQALVAPGLGLVPAGRGADAVLVWQAHDLTGAAFPAGTAAGTEPVTVREAAVELTAAMREVVTAFARLDLATTGADPAALARARRAGESPEVPPGHPGPAVALLAQARRLTAVLELARQHPGGGAVDRVGLAGREAALRGLETAVRRARVAAYNAGSEPGAVAG